MRKHHDSRPRDGSRSLPRSCPIGATAGLDPATDAGRQNARLRVATRLARRLTDATLLAACRARGLRHVSTGVAAAHALAALAVPDEGSPPVPAAAPARPAASSATEPATHPDPLVLSALAEVLAIVVARHAGVRGAAGRGEVRPAGGAHEAARDALDLLAARGIAVGRCRGAQR